MQLTSRLEKTLISSVIIIVGIVGCYFVENLYKFRQNQLLELQISNAEHKASQITNALSLSLQKKIYAAYSLANIISSQQELTDQQRQAVSQNLLNYDPQLMGVGIALNDIINFVYPTLPYSFALGEETSSEIQAQLDHFKENPYSLAQGSIQALNNAQDMYILRSPIFSGDINNRIYQGHILLLVNLQKVLDEAQHKNSPYIIALQHKQHTTPVFGNPDALKKPLFISDIKVNNQDWGLYVADKIVANKTHSIYDNWYLNNSVRWYGYSSLGMLLMLFSVISIFYLHAKKRSMQDELTGLPNRRYFIYTLKNLINNAAHYQSSFALLNIDLDDFKLINDRYGHASGDSILQQVAQQLRNSVRSHDTIARVGGDEFLIIVSRVKNRQQLVHLVQQIQSHLEQHQYDIQGTFLHIKVSIGYSLFQDPDTNIDQLLSEADISMYHNKSLKRHSQKFNDSALSDDIIDKNHTNHTK
ncbi:GGDEF domain-containing protein [Vibrio rarus]|uniref:sensor domain-containing diguanylate cyclase n=1 Tax=Vibrio rarus TaxID=413403 RepID=UPI0021C37AA9|nr:GGDEF domain-containing protein [Vibrio rarus]